MEKEKVKLEGLPQDGSNGKIYCIASTGGIFSGKAPHRPQRLIQASLLPVKSELDPSLQSFRPDYIGNYDFSEQRVTLLSVGSMHQHRTGCFVQNQELYEIKNSFPTSTFSAECSSLIPEKAENVPLKLFAIENLKAQEYYRLKLSELTLYIPSWELFRAFFSTSSDVISSAIDINPKNELYNRDKSYVCDETHEIKITANKFLTKADKLTALMLIATPGAIEKLDEYRQRIITSFTKNAQGGIYFGFKFPWEGIARFKYTYRTLNTKDYNNGQEERLVMSLDLTNINLSKSTYNLLYEPHKATPSIVPPIMVPHPPQEGDEENGNRDDETKEPPKGRTTIKQNKHSNHRSTRTQIKSLEVDFGHEIEWRKDPKDEPTEELPPPAQITEESLSPEDPTRSSAEASPKDPPKDKKPEASMSQERSSSSKASRRRTENFPEDEQALNWDFYKCIQALVKQKPLLNEFLSLETLAQSERGKNVYSKPPRLKGNAKEEDQLRKAFVCITYHEKKSRRFAIIDHQLIEAYKHDRYTIGIIPFIPGTQLKEAIDMAREALGALAKLHVKGRWKGMTYNAGNRMLPTITIKHTYKSPSSSFEHPEELTAQEISKAIDLDQAP